jgi:hypothetical protein
MKLCTNFFEIDVPAGSEIITSNDPADVNEDCIVLKLKNFGMVTIEVIYTNDSETPFMQLRDSLANDAEAIGAVVIDTNADASEFSMQSTAGNEPFIHHHLLVQRNDFVFDSNFFKNYNPEDLSDVKTMLNSIVLLSDSKEISGLVTGKRMPIMQAQVTN